MSEKLQEFIIFTDGGGFPSPGQVGFNASSAMLMFHRTTDQPINKAKLYDSYAKVTLQRTHAFAEFEQIAVALERLFAHLSQSPESERNKTTIQIVTDSRNSYMTLTTWIYSWLKNSTGIDAPLRNSKGKTPENMDIIMRAFIAKSHLNEMGVAINFYHINSHTAKKKIRKSHLKFQQDNNCVVTLDEFAFIYMMNEACDEAVKKAYETYQTTGELEFQRFVQHETFTKELVE